MSARVGLLGLFVCIMQMVSYGQVAPPPRLGGVWDGAIELAGQRLEIRVVFAESASGLSAAIDIPQQGAGGRTFRVVRLDGRSLHMELAAGSSVAVFDGTVEDDRIAGTFSQGAAKGTFSLARGSTAVPVPASAPYRQDEVVVTNGAVKLAGTLTIPEGRGPFPAVVLLSGSGGQNRDEEIFGFRIFGIIADHLTRRGIAVYRYDDRGIGGSSGSLTNATSEDFAGDALAAIAHLNTRPEINGNRVGLLGHSEGAVVAAIAGARSPDVAFAVMLAGPGVRGEPILQQQAADVARAQGASEENVELILAAHRKAIAAVRENAPRAEIERLAGELAGAQFDALPATQRAAVGDRAAVIARAARSAAAQLMSPWMRFILDFDPAPALRQLKCPVLAIFGSLDTQVTTSLNEAPVRAALAANPNATVNVYEGANHLFQKARTGLFTEYATLERAFVPGLLDEIAGWILKVTEGSR